MRAYAHPIIGEEIRAIGGGYTTLKERLWAEGERQVVVAVRVAQVDSSCCGTGGCTVADVPGYLVEYQSSEDEEGRPVSLVEPIVDDGVRQRLAEQIRQAEKVQQVRFWTGGQQ